VPGEQRCRLADPLARPLAHHFQTSVRPQVGEAQAGELGEAQAGVEEQEQDRPIAR